MYGKLSEAIYRLAVGEGNIKTRLTAASEIFFAVDATMLPPEIGKRWSELSSDMNRFPATAYRTSFEETLHRVHFKTAASFARRLIAIKFDLEGHL